MHDINNLMSYNSRNLITTRIGNNHTKKKIERSLLRWNRTSNHMTSSLCNVTLNYVFKFSQKVINKSLILEAFI